MALSKKVPIGTNAGDSFSILSIFSNTSPSAFG
jgi:hypothetical protein